MTALARPRLLAALRFFDPAVAWPIVVGLIAAGLVALYLVAMTHARIQLRELRQQFCAHLVSDVVARNPYIARPPRLADSCLELDVLTGEQP